MKILQIIQKPQLRGAETFACQLSEHLIQMGHEVIIVTLFDGDSTLPFSGKISHLKRNKNKRFLDLEGYKLLNNIVRAFEPDIVQANASDSLKYAVFSKMIFRWKSRLVFRNASMISRYLKKQPSILFNSYLMRKVDFTISVSKTTRTDYCKTFPFMEDRTFVVPIGINEENVAKPKKNEEEVYIHIGGFSFEKNHKGLIDIFERVIAKKSHVKLWLVGDGPLQQEIRQLVKAKDLERNIIFLNSRRDVPELLDQAKALLLSSVIEGLPAVILEAFYHKVPVITYDTGAIHELVENEVTGFLIPQQDEEQFASAILNLDHHKGVEAIRENAYAKVCNYYTNKIIAQNLLKLYQSRI